MRFRATRLSEAAAEMLKLREGTPSYVMDELNLRLHVLPFLGKKFLTEIAPADVEELAVQLARGGKGRKPLAPSFVQQAIRRLASVFTWTKKKLFFGDSPTREAKRPKIPKRLPKRLSDAQVVKLLSESRQWHDLFWFAATTGLREGELCAFEWTHLVLDTEEPHVLVAGSRSADTPKDFEERVVPIPRDVAEMLRRRRDSATSRYVWPGPDGEMQRRADTVYGDAFKEAAVRAGLVRGWAHACNCGHHFFAPTRRPRRCPKCPATVLPKVVRGEFTFRHLRSTYASALGNPVLAQKALGHSDLSTTMVHYYQVDAAKVREAAEVLPFAVGAGRLAATGQIHAAQQSGRGVSHARQ
ncbi:Site-specific recombinase XerC [Myxococcus virescens]|uniref:Site-specific recombinase XerC n=2 Tax=Myxococcus virescens TaxID=83456 RepID=A0ABY0ML22_9BACT|nr:Site-specific recombinase XerC [Myxococcus virescens]